MPAPFTTLFGSDTSALNLWVSNWEKYKAVVPLLSSCVYSSGMFLEDRFLSVAQALEGLCRLEDNPILCSKKNFRTARDAFFRIIIREGSRGDG